MKKPNLAELGNVQTKDKFVETVKEVKTERSQIKPKTYSLPKRTTDYINQQAFQLGQKRGKVVSASEALRVIVDEHEARVGL